MSLSECVAIVCLYALASGALIDAWRNGSLFAPLRGRLEAMAAQSSEWHFVAELVSCDFCLSFQVPFWLLLYFYVPGLVFPTAALFMQLPVFALAAARVAWLLNGLLPDRLKYLRDDNVV